MAKSVVDLIALILVIIGGLNWGLVGLGVGDVVTMILGAGIAQVIFIIVGIAALYSIYMAVKE